MLFPGELASVFAKHLNLSQVPSGFRVRVDDIGLELAQNLSQELRKLQLEKIDVDPNLDIAILTRHPNNLGFEVDRDKAINLRNRSQKLLLLVPEADSVSEGSLDNSFRRVSIGDILEAAVQSALSAVVQKYDSRDVSKLAKAAREGSASGLDQWVFWNLVHALEDLNQAGTLLWRLGLIPDFAPDFLARIEKNRFAASVLFGRQKSFSGTLDRLNKVGISDPGFRSLLMASLDPFPVHARNWLEQICIKDREELSFHRWPISQAPGADFESIQLTPFINSKGDVASWSKLTLSDGQLIAHEQVLVKWKITPDPIVGASGFKISIIPAQEYREDDAVPIYEKNVGINSRQHLAKISAPEELTLSPLYVVEISLVDSENQVIRDSRGVPGTDESLEFAVDKTTFSEVRKGVTNASNLLEGKIKFAIRSTSTDLRLDSPFMSDGVFSVTVNSKDRIRIQAPAALAQIQAKIIGNPQSAGYLKIDSGSAPKFNISLVESVEQDIPREVLKRRSDLFALLESQGAAQSHPQFADWSAELLEVSEAYLRSYFSQLRKSDGAVTQALTRLDLIEVTIGKSGRQQVCLIVPPVSPLRLAWLMRYNELGSKWLQGIMSLNSQNRPKSFDERLLSNLAPRNIPWLALDSQGHQLIYRTELVQDFGLLTPIELDSPSGLVSQVRDFFDVQGPPVEKTAIPARLARRLKDYASTQATDGNISIHLYEPPSSKLIAQALRSSELEDEFSATKSLVPIRLVISGSGVHQGQVVSELRLLARDFELVRGVAAGPFHADHLEIVFQEKLSEGLLRSSNLALVEGISVARFAQIELRNSVASLDGLMVTRQVFGPDESGRTFVAIAPVKEISKPDRSQLFAALSSTYLTTVGDRLGIAEGKIPAIEVEPRWSGNILDQLADSSDWIVTVDDFVSPHHLAFAGAGRGKSQIVLDYTPDFVDGFGPKMAVYTQSEAHLNRLVQRAMDRLEIPSDWDAAARLVKDLSLISGRLPLSILQSTTDALGAIGLAVSVRKLKVDGELAKSVLIPLDSHLDLFRDAPGGNSRCDFALLRFTKRGHIIELIEVKNYSSVDEGLLRRMKRQIDSTYARLGFLATRTNIELDSSIQWARWCGLIRFYAGRQKAAGLMTSSEYEHVRFMVDKIETSHEPPQEIKKRGIVVNIPNSLKLPARFEDMDVQLIGQSDFQHTALIREDSLWRGD